MGGKKPNIIKDKSFAFALRIVKLNKLLIEKKEFVLSKQLLRSGTAVGALVREAEHAESTADFIHKLIFQSEYLEKAQYNSIILDIQELNKILASIIITSKEKKYVKR